MVGGWGGTPLSAFNLGFRVAYIFVYVADNTGYTYHMLVSLYVSLSLLLMLMLNVTVCIIYFITLAHLSVTP